MTWVFGYGSLIWRPDFDYLERREAWLVNYTRRFWQGSHDHRGTPEAPGRVVTLVHSAGARCKGVAYALSDETLDAVFENLDFREKNGYTRIDTNLNIDGYQGSTPGVTYIAAQDNFAYLGHASLEEIALQIATSHGPSGSNADYLFELARALTALDADDPHVFDLESKVRTLV